METLGNLRRTHYAEQLINETLGKEVTVAGFVARSRNLGNLIFTDVRDVTGIVQLAFDDATDRAIFDKAKTIRSEFTLIAKGILRERSSKTDKIATGAIEVYVTELHLLSGADTTPFEIKDDVNVRDDLALKYRYLDLRRPTLTRNMVLRHKIAKIARDYFDEQHFVEIETPYLTKSTPEGARDYLVP
ncbi:MAG: Asp-tRNA(Asn)/Glu-tRNA(Gln) amidotransferase GatCAB subunit C, partial [Oscillospiraceae bacterium]|nr:Asp-tRNA(Asn)/Glu-tRNA(Gln) amidotransferase GatCAB subunit C [Oscillospiraceae bacterium]